MASILASRCVCGALVDGKVSRICIFRHFTANLKATLETLSFLIWWKKSRDKHLFYDIDNMSLDLLWGLGNKNKEIWDFFVAHSHAQKISSLEKKRDEICYFVNETQ